MGGISVVDARYLKFVRHWFLYFVLTLFAEALFLFHECFNPLMPRGNKNVKHTSTNLQLKAAGLFKYV